MALRAVSTLHTPKEFKLSRDERLTGFLPLYEARYREHVSLVINSLVLQGFLPMARNDRFLAGVKRQVLNEVLTALVGDLRSRANKSILRPSSDPKKPGYDFEFELVPASTGMLLLTKKGQITFLSSCGIKMSMAEEDNYQEVDTVGLVLTGEDVRNNCVSLGPVLRNSLASSLKSMSVDSEGTITVTMHLTKREVEFMTSTPLIAVRPGNLYALLSLWVASTLGNTTRMPVASMSITHISKAVTAASAGKDVAARNKNNSIVVLEEGGLAYIPDVDQSAQYEQALHDYGIQEDGSYCFSPPKEAQTEYKIGQESTGKKLPINMPILTDWVNLKFAYSNTEGRLAVLDLDRSVKLRPTHVRRFLELNMTKGKGAAFLSKMALLLQVFGIKIAPTAEQLSQYNTSIADVNALVALPLVDYVAKIGSLTVNLRLSEELSVEDDLKLTLIREDSVVAPFRAVAEAFKQLQAAIEGNFDKAYRAVSVLSFIELFAGLRLINAYAKDFDKVVQIDVDQRSVYIKQGVDPEHTPEPLPFMRKGSFMLPHQKKTENLMRGNPAFAIYSIDAGGGKCLTGENVVATKQGLLTLDEMRLMSGSCAGDKGFRSAEFDIVSSWGMQKTDSTYQRKGKTVRVKFSDGTIVEGLPDHRFWAYKYSEGFQYVRLDKLTADHLIEKKIGLGLFGTKTDLTEYRRKAASSLTSKAKTNFDNLGNSVPRHLTEDLARVLGYLVAEGYTPLDTEGRNLAVFHNKDSDVLKDYSDSLSALFGENSYRIKAGSKGLTSVEISDKATRTFIRSLLTLGTSSFKEVPLCVRQAPREIQTAFLSSLFEGDGTIYWKSMGVGKEDSKHATLAYTTISWRLALQAKVMLENLGIPATIKSRKGYLSSNGTDGTVTERRPYEVCVNYRYQDKFAEIGFRSSRKKAALAAAIDLLEDSLSNEDNRNIESRGSWNKLNLRREYLDLLEETADLISECNIEITTAPQVRHYDSGIVTEVAAIVRTQPAHIRAIWKEALADSKGPNSYGRCVKETKLPYVSRLNIDYLRQFAKHCAQRTDQIGKLFRTRLSQKYDEFFGMADKFWVRPLGRKEGSYRDVYDLSVPGPHDYVVNGMMSHNTMLVLTNVLKELKQGHCKRPIILCPGHLVQGYIKDAVYFTEGKVNMIPITAYSIRQNGYERIQEMIKRAPPNTIFVSDYDFLKRSKERIAYGVRPVFVFRNVEFLRQFKFDLVAADESHYLKNDSTRSEAAQRFMAEIPRKRLCSGTIVTDTPMDIVAQASIMDPSIFGSRGDFATDYAQEMKGEKVMVWKEGAGRNIRAQLQEHVVWVDCRRKEWATLLPDPDETFHAVDLTPNQMACYQSLLEKTMDDIKNAAAKDPKLKAALDAAEDENVFDSLAALLKPYLSRLESFLAAPAKDKLGQELLTEPSDRMSPKVAKIIDLCRTHLSTGIKGKILIFTNHIAVAEEIYNSFPPDLKKQAIHYIAAEKLECGAAFEGDDRKTIMVGVEKSMNTGLNLQFASRLIRIETVWTPGEMEQGNSRINRPELKKEDVRDKIYLDWIVCNKTFDITKVSRLVSKMIQKAKFDEPHNPEFQALTEPPMMAMTLNNIIAQNDFAQELAPYLEAYQDYKQVLYTDYRNYREEHKDEMDPTLWVRSENLPGSKLMARTPYIPDMALYGSDQLGLLRYDEYMRIDPDDLETEDEGEDEGDDEDEAEDNSSRGSAQRQANRAELAKVEGLGVHTEFGDGTIIGCGKIRLKIRLANGDVVRPRKLACYVITRRDTSTKDIRKQLLKMSGDIPIDTPIDVPATSIKSGSRRDRKAVEDTEPPVTTSVQVELYLTIVNDFLALGVQDTEDQTAVGALSKFGFRLIPEHYTALIRTPQALLKLYKAWSVAGLKMYRGPTMRAKELYEKVKNKSKMNIVGLATKLSLRNFLLMEYKASGDTNAIKPYPMLRDGMLYVGLPRRNQAGTAAAIRVAVPTVKWVVAEPEMLRFVVSKQEVVEVIKSLMAAGIEVTNLDELGKVWKKIRVVRNPEAETEDSDE